MRRVALRTENSHLLENNQTSLGPRDFNRSSLHNKSIDQSGSHYLLKNTNIKRNSRNGSNSVFETSNDSSSGKHISSPLKKNHDHNTLTDTIPTKKVVGSVEGTELPGLKRKTVFTRVHAPVEDCFIKLPRRYSSLSNMKVKNPSKLDSDWHHQENTERPSEFARLNLSFLNNQFNLLEAQQPKLHTTTRRSEHQVGHRSMDHMRLQTKKQLNYVEAMLEEDEALANSGLPDGSFLKGHPTSRLF
jgi:hypothetical protein